MDDVADRWQGLFERAAEYDVAEADVIEAVDALRETRRHD